jgi:peptidyl-prolyl cis-trans isomerase SurA
MRRPFALLFSLLFAVGAGAQELVDGIAAQVGSEIVLISDVYQIAEPTEKRIRGAGATNEDIAMLRAEVLEQLIERALIQQVVRRAELDATEAEIDHAIDGIANENGLSVEELKQSVEAQGLSFQAYRERIRGEIEHAKVVNGMVGGQVRIEEKDIRALYDEEYGDQPAGGIEVHLRHILIPFDGEDPASRLRACEQAGQALDRIRGGESFENVAAEVSAMNPEQGGDIGWFLTDSLASWMTAAIEALPEGGTTEVLEMPFGCNLLQVVERRPYEQVTYESVRGRLGDYLYQQRLGEAYGSFIEELRERTFIERKGIFADAARLGDGKETGADAVDLGLGNDAF